MADDIWSGVITRHEWIESPFEDHQIEDAIETGESQGYVVRCRAASHVRAFLKPLRKEPGKSRAAAEKICTDLARLLSLPVPRVMLCDRQVDDSRERYVCLSEIAVGETIKWSQLSLYPGATKVQLAAEAAIREHAGIVVLDTWVGNRDRNNGGNTVVRIRPDAEVEIVFIDFAFSLNVHSAWDDGAWRDIQITPCLPALEEVSRIWGQVERTIAQVLQLREVDIVGIVDPIPDEFLPPQQKQVIKEALLHRRGRLEPVFRQHCAE